ncbi:hypothetical protein EYZ11_001296 [Aspergillus tanneri]|uniref:orotate phosphoribosyltransferase n=1 Tax=Aspergillus tanneri TaxID=1220188 RepID=A0A4S3JUX1_9EURO|nr:hypothetical protein EYZ11_001296 [Aspergillus tanneri]
MASTLPAYKTAFLESCLSANVLTFGTFTLKSGRHSPYFFNAGSFHTSALLSSISTAYAHTIISFLAANPSIPKPDVIFGYNRKEAKDHGEGGNIVGSSLKGKNVLVIDDVITAGTAMRETLSLVSKEGGKVVGFAVALDRLEKMPGPKEKEGIDDGEPRMSAMGQIRREYGVPTASIVTLDDLIMLMKDKGDEDDLKKLEAYRKRYQASD